MNGMIEETSSCCRRLLFRRGKQLDYMYFFCIGIEVFFFSRPNLHTIETGNIPATSFVGNQPDQKKTI